MSLRTMYLRADNNLSSFINEWASYAGIVVEFYDERREQNEIDGLVVLTNNQDPVRADQELQDSFDKRHIPTRKIDLNGTLQVAVSGFNLWVKNNKCEKILFIGSEDLVKNENLTRFFDRLKTISA